MLSPTTWHTGSKATHFLYFSVALSNKIRFWSLLRVPVDKYKQTKRTTGCCCGSNCVQHPNLPVTNSENYPTRMKPAHCPCFCEGWSVGGKPQSSQRWVKKAVKRLQSGIFSLLLELHWLTAQAYYLLGKTHWKKHGRRPSVCISPSGRPGENEIPDVHSFLIISELQFTVKMVKIQTNKQKKVTCPPTWSPVGGARIWIYTDEPPDAAEAPPPRPPLRNASPNQVVRLNLEFWSGPIVNVVT